MQGPQIIATVPRAKRRRTHECCVKHFCQRLGGEPRRLPTKTTRFPATALTLQGSLEDRVLKPVPNQTDRPRCSALLCAQTLLSSDNLHCDSLYCNCRHKLYRFDKPQQRQNQFLQPNRIYWILS